jgi:serine/threonine protein phosphatase PrpC
MVGDADPSRACRNLIKTARDRGGYDNITLAVIAIPAEAGRSAALKETGQYEVDR